MPLIIYRPCNLNIPISQRVTGTRGTEDYGEGFEIVPNSSTIYDQGFESTAR